MEEELLDRYAILAVGAELRHVFHHRLRDIQFAVLHQQPGGGREKALGAGEDHVERLVGGGLCGATLHGFAKCAGRADFAIARDGELAGRQQPFPHLALRAFEQRFHFRRIKTDLGRTACVQLSL